MKFSFSLAHNCDLACRYCYAGPKFKRETSMHAAARIIGFAFARMAAGEGIDADFFGGEPLPKFPLMADIGVAVKQRNEREPHRLSFHVTTNGTCWAKARSVR
jgi:sulfatase maturation enzyme AslB (radical SAM superfamily)